jgi:hypothetical protein
MQAANLFDLRRIIGGLFVIYGIVLTIVGAADSQEEIDKAAGVQINLWTGIGLLVIGGLFLLWAFTRPLGRELQRAEAEASQQPGGGPRGDGERAGRNGHAGAE